MLELNLKRIFKARGIDMPYKFLVKNGFVPFTAHKYKNGKVEHMRLDHIEKLCILLNCTPNELFEWTPDDLLDDRKDNPLQKIRKRDKKLEISKILSRMSLEKLEEVEKMLQTEAPPPVEGELRIPKTKRAKAKAETETVAQQEPALEPAIEELETEAETDTQEPEEDFETFEDVADAILEQQRLQEEKLEQLKAERKPLKRRQQKEKKEEGLLLFPNRDE